MRERRKDGNADGVTLHNLDKQIMRDSNHLDWGEVFPQIGDRLRAGKLAELLAGHGFEGDRLYTKIPFEKQEVNAYPDAVCMAFLEYYAFEADERNRTEEARNNCRAWLEGVRSQFDCPDYCTKTHPLKRPKFVTHPLKRVINSFFRGGVT